MSCATDLRCLSQSIPFDTSAFSCEPEDFYGGAHRGRARGRRSFRHSRMDRLSERSSPWYALWFGLQYGRGRTLGLETPTLGNSGHRSRLVQRGNPALRSITLRRPRAFPPAQSADNAVCERRNKVPIERCVFKPSMRILLLLIPE
jgi:hypothetical protein